MTIKVIFQDGVQQNIVTSRFLLQTTTGNRCLYLVSFYTPSLNISFKFECIFVNMMIDAQLYFHNNECEVIEAIY